MDISKYSTQGNRKLIAMVITIASILLIAYTIQNETGQTAIWGVVSIGTAFITGNLIKHGMDRYRNTNNNDYGYDEPEY